MNLKNILSEFILFVKEHKLFTLFMVSAFLLNLFLLLHKKNEKTEYITCSTYDKGIAGTYGLYRDLEDRGVHVKRLKLPIFKEFDKKDMKNNTLVILSPTFSPGEWEWQLIMDWVAKGNRLITSGFIGPKKMGIFPGLRAESKTTNMAISESRILLPVDERFPYDESLAGLSRIEKAPLLGQLYKENDSALISYFDSFGPDVLPFMSYGNKVTALKRVIGEGEWVIFAERNPFSNSILRHPSWYWFATRFFTGDPQYEGKMIYFDEFHNGFRATKSLWQIISYYKFDSGFIYICILILLFLFLTGIRIVTPEAERVHINRNAILGMKAISQLLYKYDAYKGLIDRELHIIKKSLFKGAFDKTIEADQFVVRYLMKRKLPDTVSSREELITLINNIENEFKSFSKEELLKIFNTLMLMRKELAK